MASNFCAVFFHVLATLLGWGSFAISIGSVAVADWVRFDVEPDLRIGLFESCTITTDECEPISGKLNFTQKNCTVNINVFPRCHVCCVRSELIYFATKL